MKDEERDVILGILPRLAADVFIIFGWASIVLEPSLYVLGVPNWKDPQASGKRTVERQVRYIKQGKSKWRGSPRASPHVTGRAIHLILRHEKNRAPIFYDPETGDPDANAAFLVVVDRMKLKGWTWGGDWDTSKEWKDWQHFEK